MSILHYAIILPIIAGVVALLLNKKAGIFTVIISALIFLMSIAIFLSGEITPALFSLRAYTLSSGCFLSASLFTLLISIYSLKSMEGKDRLGEYYGYCIATLGCSAGVFFATDLLTLAFFWGMLAALLYLLIGISGAKASGAAKKALMIVGGADALVLVGIAIIVLMTQNAQFGSFRVELNAYFPVLAFICLLSGALAKAGAMPLHAWIPDSSEVAEAPVMALLPASLDKLLGIYLLARLCLDIFHVTPNSTVSILLMAIGSFTIVAAVMAALVQHDLRKLLSFHAISQVGYMVLGIGTAVPVGIAGGLFHMLNNAIYKSGLFLAGGAVEKSTGSTELDKLGGLAIYMPITFICTLIFSLSISGIPPFNGFASKWMVYQGILETSKSGNFWILWLLAAMLGSAFTLASFIKLLHAVFLGQPSRTPLKPKETSPYMWWPLVALSSLCVLFGIFAYGIPLKYFILPSVKGVAFSGFWSPSLATGLLLAALFMGVLVYMSGKILRVTSRAPYIGGESLEEAAVKVNATQFYDSIIDWGALRPLYNAASKRSFDLYDIGSNIIFGFNDIISRLHNGLLNVYVSWIFIGAIAVYLMVR